PSRCGPSPATWNGLPLSYRYLTAISSRPPKGPRSMSRLPSASEPSSATIPLSPAEITNLRPRTTTNHRHPFEGEPCAAHSVRESRPQPMVGRVRLRHRFVYQC